MLEMHAFYNELELNEKSSRQEVVDFLYTHLEHFGDKKADINRSIDYAFSQEEGRGGFVLIGWHENKIAGVLVMNDTGMQGYIPENILVYIAVDASHRGKGFGKAIIERSFELCEGDVKLHVEYENPAKRLYERIGFVNKYAEMRYEKTGGKYGRVKS